MVDEIWLRNLARAKFNEGNWQFEGTEDVETIVQSRIERSVSDLFDLAYEAVTVYNLHASAERAIKLLASSGDAGFTLLCGGVQVRLNKVKQTLIVSQITVEGFASKPEVIGRFTPLADPFGAIVWSENNRLIMEGGMLVKKILEQLIKESTLKSGTRSTTNKKPNFAEKGSYYEG